MAIEANLPGNDSKHDNSRRSGKYLPAIWGHYFESFPFPEMEFESINKQVQLLKENIKEILMDSTKNPIDNIESINLLCRLGVSYHFEAEIKDQLAHIFGILPIFFGEDHEYDLYTVALLFRVLRQHGYKVPCDVFHKFKDNEGFKKHVSNDIKGLLSLYEAAYLRFHGEDIMEEALIFTRQKLKETLVLRSCPHFEKQIKKALGIPFHLGVPRIEAREYISFYEEDESPNQILLEFAKLDFNRVQLLHKQELNTLSRWWRDLNLMEKLPYLRDRIVQAYVWAIGIHFYPQYEVARIMFTKYMMLVSVVDDTYDSYATFEEVKCFTKAIERWDISAMDNLPAYMRVLYKALLDPFSETEKETIKDGRSYSADYTKEAFTRLVKANHVEAQWSNEQYVPSLEEYMHNGTISIPYEPVIASSFTGTQVAGIEEYQWLMTTPKIVRAGMLISRLMNDIAGHEEEQKKGDCASAVECYVKEHGVIEKEAVEELLKKCSDAWKVVNEEFMRPTLIPRLLLQHCVNLIRLTQVFYRHDDAFTNPLSLKDYVKSLFMDQLPL